MFAARMAAELYRCPGEEYDISRPVHLARLAAYYSKCRACPHAPDSHNAAASPDSPLLPARAALDRDLFTREGIRGRYLNELDRTKAAAIAGAMASCLWDDLARTEPVLEGLPVHHAVDASHPEDVPSVAGPVPAGPPGIEGIRLFACGRPGPCVALGHDERPSSPDITVGVGQALRRMGCQVIDVGLAPRPALVFAVDHLAAAGGVHVTGAGCDPGWTGLDFLMPGSVPGSAPGELDRIATRYRQGYSRPSRRPGSQRNFQAAVPYEAGLWKHFHALRPLKIVLACPSRTVRELFGRVFRKLACRLIVVEIPTRQRAAADSSDPDFRRTSHQIGEIRADLGVLVEDDAERCTFFDEQGRAVPHQLAAQLLACDHNHAGRMAVPASRGLPLSTAETSSVQPTREAIVRELRERRSTFAADGAGRYWFAEAYPACDALLTLVHLLQILSRSDAPLSEVVGASG